MNYKKPLLVILSLTIGISAPVHADEDAPRNEPLPADWMICTNNHAQERNAWYVGNYRGPDSAASDIDLARDSFCAKIFKEQHFPNGFVTVFGSSAIAETVGSTLFSKDFSTLSEESKSTLFHHFYADIQSFANAWTSKYGKSYPILTGAGPGLMEAASRGAMSAGGPSVGYTTYYQNPKTKEFEGMFWRHNGTEQITSTGLIFSTVSARETAMITHSAAAVFAPGGTGTSWEIFQLLEMIKSHQLRPIPVYFLGKQEEWSPLTNMISEMVAHGTIKNTITPIFIDCSQDLVNHLAYDLKLTTTPPSDPSTACKTPTPYETKARLEQGIM